MVRSSTVSPSPSPEPTSPSPCTTASRPGLGSLHEAILEANANAEPDTIYFAIPGGGPHTIALFDALPPITEAVVIDGLTQHGAAANTADMSSPSNATLKVVVNGQGHGPIFALQGGSAVLRGLAIRTSATNGVEITSAGNVVEGCYVGTDASGTAQFGSFQHGIAVLGAAARGIELGVAILPPAT